MKPELLNRRQLDERKKVYPWLNFNQKPNSVISFNLSIFANKHIFSGLEIRGSNPSIDKFINKLHRKDETKEKETVKGSFCASNPAVRGSILTSDCWENSNPKIFRDKSFIKRSLTQVHPTLDRLFQVGYFKSRLTSYLDSTIEITRKRKFSIRGENFI